MGDGTINPMHSTRTVPAAHGQFFEEYPDAPNGGTLIANSHWHNINAENRHAGSSFSDSDKIKGKIAPVFHNDNRDSRYPYGVYYRGWRWFMNSSGGLTSPEPY